MKVTDLAIRLRISVVVLAVLASAGGFMAYVQLPKESAPSIEISNIVVTTIYPGASPADVESLVTRPLETEIQSISGIEVMRSTSTEGVSTIVIEFTPDVTLTEANTSVREKVDLALPEMPSEVEEPIISEIDLSQFPILTVNLAADYPLARLKKVAEDLKDAIEGIPAILEVDLLGGREQEVQVNVDWNRMQAYGVTFDDLLQTIRRENANIPGGSIDVDDRNYLVRVDAQFREVREIEGLVIKAPGGQPIAIRDVAQVVLGFKDRTDYSRLRVLRRDHVLRGPERVPDRGYLTVISLNVKKRAGKNIIGAADEVRALLADYTLPPGTEVLVTGDQSKGVVAMVRDLENNIISGLFFVVAVLLFFLGLRTAMLVGIAIPLSMMVTFIVFTGMDETLNFIILFSLIIALGMLVDNAVVIVENIYRFLEEGLSPFEAAREGTAEVGMAVVASTATTVAAFVPMLFWPGFIGKFMSYMPMTLIVTLTSSLFVAIIINPVITGYLVRMEGEERQGPGWSWFAKGVVVTGVGLAGVVLEQINSTVLLVLVGGAVAVMLSYVLLLRPVARLFVGRGLPLLVAVYRRLLRWMLTRDYEARFAMFRNAWALGSLTAGVVLGAAGGAVALVDPQAAMLVLYPAGALAALGLAGVVLHTGETVLAGLLSVLLRRRVRLILTDNRARLMHLTLGGLLSIVALFALAPTGSAFFPETDPNQVQVHVEGALGTHVEASNQLVRRVRERVDGLLATNPVSESSVLNVLVTVGVGGDAMFGGGAASPERSQITLNLVDFEDRAEPSTATLKKLRDQLEGIAGARIEFKKDQQGPPTGPPVNIELSGPDFATLVRLARELKATLAELSETGKVKGLVDVRDNLKDGRPEVAVRINRERAARYGIDPQRIALDVRTAINGTKAGTFRDGEDEYDITVRLRPQDRASLDSLKALDVVKEDKRVPLVTVAEFTPGSGLGSITRKDARRVITVQGNARAGVNAQEMLGQVRQHVAPLQKALPAGYTMRYTGENQEQQESFAFLGTALATGAALILMILIAQFNSVLTPFVIMIAVALSMIGVMLGLILTRTPFSLFTFIGVISLAGIVVNNNIVLIDYIQQLHARGQSRMEAIVNGGATRLRPVLLTAMTTVLGLIPLTFGINIDFIGLATQLDPDLRIGSANQQFWGPMGIAIVSGLTFATFLTLVIVPVMYSLSDSLARRAAAAFGRGDQASGETT